MTRNHYESAAFIALLMLLPTAAFAIDAGPYEITLQADVRGVAIDSSYKSFVYGNGGLGLLRYDEEHDGVRLGRLLANFNGPLTDTLRADITFSGTGDHDTHAIDVTEAFAEWRPVPTDNFFGAQRSARMVGTIRWVS